MTFQKNNVSNKRLLTKPLANVSSGEMCNDLIPPDGGWGWVIVMASFYCCFIVDGIASIVGVLLPRLLVCFDDATPSQMSLSVSLYVGLCLFTGKFASICLNKVGCRATTIIGTLITVFSIVVSTFATTPLFFIIFFGVFAGIGVGMIFLPASVMVNYYFFHHRGLANGIASSGAGAGILILSPLTDFLCDYYGWRGCLVILSGLSLQCIICGCLMRPLEASIVSCGSPPSAPSAPAVPSLPIHSSMQQLEPLEENKEADFNIERAKFENFIDENDDDDLEVESIGRSARNSQDIRVKGSSNNRFEDFLEALKPPTRLFRDFFSNSSTKQKKNKKTQSNTELSRQMHNLSSTNMSSTNISGPRRGRLVSESYSLFEHANPRSSMIMDPKWLGLDRRTFYDSTQKRISTTKVVIPPMRKMDIFYGGSISSLNRVMSQCPSTLQPMGTITSPTFNESMILGLPINIEPIQEVDEEKEKEKTMLLKVLDAFNFSLLLTPSFLIIALSSIFIQLGFFVPILFLSDHVISLGFPSHYGAIMLSVLGGSNMVGRAVGGAIASIPSVNILHLNGVSIIISGLVTLIFPFFHSLPFIILYALVFGLFAAFFIPLIPMFLVKYLGLHMLTDSFGMLCVIKGFASIAGPPLAAALYSLNQCYDHTFYFSGIMFFLAASTFYSIVFIPSCSLSNLVTECACVNKNTGSVINQQEKEKNGVIV